MLQDTTVARDVNNASMTSAQRPLYRFHAQLDPMPIGIVPEGLRMVNAFEGTISEGILPGARVWGIDHLLLRSDGVAIIDAPKTLSLGDTHVHEHVRGYCLPPAGMTLPPLEALLEPGFEWPDVDFPVLGFTSFRAAAPELAYLNRALGQIRGAANFSTGRLVIETRLLT